MPVALRLLRATGIAIVFALCLQGFGGLTVGPAAVADSIVVATATVNIRSGPSTSNNVVGVLGSGVKIAVAGASSGGWTPVSYRGRTAYIYSQYLRASSASSTPSTQSGAAGGATTLEALNVRTGPGLGYRVVTVLRKGASVSLNGVTSNGYSQLLDGRWVSTTWIATATPAPAPAAPAPSPTTAAPVTPPVSNLPTVTGRVRATAPLMIRTTSDASFRNLGDVPSGTILDVTSVVTNGVAQVVYRGAVRWVNANYIVPVGAAGPSVPPTSTLPAITGTMYALAALDIRSSSAASAATITEIPAGTAVSITGVTENGRMQVIYSQAVRWVTAKYLSPSAVVGTPSSKGMSSLQPRTQVLVNDVQGRFTQIRTFYGVRPDALPDHPSGRAVDMMVPDYRNNAALGQQIADYYRAHAAEFKIDYIIYNQHIWSVERAGEGWRFMADRGSDTANHLDHVHITVKA